MKRNLINKLFVSLVAGAACGLVGFEGPSEALADASSSPVQSFRMHSDMLSADFYGEDATGCISTVIGFHAAENAIKDDPGQGSSIEQSYVFAYMESIDYCSYEIVFFGSGQLWGGGEIDVQKTDSGSLVAAIPMFDLVSGTEMDLLVDLTLIGVGERIQGRHNRTEDYGGMVTRMREMGATRPAEVSGSAFLSIDPTTDLLAGLAGGGSLSELLAGYMTITSRH